MTTMDELNARLAAATAHATETLSRIQTTGAANRAVLDAALESLIKTGEISLAASEQTTAVLDLLIHRKSRISHVPIIGPLIDHSLKKEVVATTAHYEEVKLRNG